MKVRSSFAAGALAVVVTILLDQLSKWWILTIVMNPPKRIPLIDFFSLVLVYNRGVSFGIFSDAPDWARWALIVFAALIAAALLIWMRYAESRLLALALGFVAGGAIGNVIDRVYYGAVVDFLDFHVGAWHWPAFNVADSAITIGVALLIVDSLKSGSKTP
jgi:signal peptidase II